MSPVKGVTESWEPAVQGNRCRLRRVAASSSMISNCSLMALELLLSLPKTLKLSSVRIKGSMGLGRPCGAPVPPLKFHQGGAA